MAENIIQKATDDLGFKARRTALFMSGKHSALAIGEAIGGPFEGAMTLSSLSTGLKGAALLASMGLGAAVSAALVQMEYQHKRHHLKKLYCEELSAKCNKPDHALSDKDLDQLASSNRTIAEHLDKTRRQRNWGIVFSVAATLASLAVVLSVVTVPTAIATALSPGLADFLVKGAAGVLTYNVIKQPLHWLGDKLFDLDRKTTHDRIVSLLHDREQGKPVSREQLLSVFVSARPQLDRLIVAEYGKHFDALDMVDKQQATAELAKVLPLDSLKRAINRGEKNITELAFAVEGDASGVAHKLRPMPDKKPGLIRAAVARIRQVMHHPQAALPLLDMVAHRAEGISATNDHPSGSFVKQLGLTPKETATAYLQQLALRDPSRTAVERIQSRMLAEAAELTGPH